MIELKFIEKEMKELILQGDARRLNKDEILVAIHNNLYEKKGDYYYNSIQMRRIKEKNEYK